MLLPLHGVLPTAHSISAYGNFFSYLLSAHCARYFLFVPSDLCSTLLYLLFVRV